MKILSFGEIIWDVYPDKNCIGGAPLNFSAHVAKNGAKSFLLSCVGNDKLGEQAKKSLEKFGVKTDFVHICDKMTGVCQVKLDDKGVPSYTIVDDVAYDYIPFDKKVCDQKFDVLCFGTLALRGDNNKRVIEQILQTKNFDNVFCDLNLRYPFFDKQTVEFCLSNANIVKVSDNEADFVCSKVLGVEYTNPLNLAKSLVQAFKNLKMVLFSCGDKGAYLFDAKQDKLYFEDAKKVDVVSTVGAGDCFGATFVTELLKGADLQSCIKRATEKSAYVVSKQDAIPD